MVVLIDWNEHVVFNTKKIVDEIRHTLFKGIDKTIDFKWFLMPEGEKSKRVKFEVKPKNEAIRFPKKLMLDKGKDSVFRLKVDADKLPDNWVGELWIESEGITRKVPLEFEKTTTTH
ncbi:MAG: hypothetical protein JW791_02765 [Nanoarchaeota archaeon]|nr:hypothetical protein [Nanoarchaeota archaeon]